MGKYSEVCEAGRFL